MDRIAELAAFVQTVERGSQAGAARALGVTPAMVGRYLRALEERLGARLLNRSTATQSLTEAGALFHTRASAILEELGAAEAAVTDRQAEPGGTLRISAPVVFGARFLAAALARFGAEHAGPTIELTLNDRQVDLVEEGFDLAVRIGALTVPGLIARRLAPCRMVAAASPAYLAQHGAPETPESLRDHQCLLYAYASDGRVARFTGRDGRVAAAEIQGRFAANNGEALLEAAIEGAGIVLSPTFIASEALRDGRLVRVLPEWSLEALGIHAVFPSREHLPTKTRLCVEALAGWLVDGPGWDDGLQLPS